MSRDFTLAKYSELLAAMEGFRPFSVADYITMPVQGKVAVLYHPVGRRPERASGMALLEKRMGLRATYYFPWYPKEVYWQGTGDDRLGNFPELRVVEAKLYGHEVGYFPQEGEDASSRLSRLRTLAPVRTSLSPVDDADLIGGPFSPEFSDFSAFSCSGRKWSGVRSTRELLDTVSSLEKVLIRVECDDWR